MKKYNNIKHLAMKYRQIHNNIRNNENIERINEKKELFKSITLHNNK